MVQFLGSITLQMIYKVIFGITLFLFLIIRGIFTVIAQRSGLSINFTDGNNERQKAGKPGLLSIIIILSILGLLLFYIIYPVESNPLIITLPNWIRIIGICICTISLVLQVAIHKTYQDSWLYAKKNNLRRILIKHGPYKWIRHPLYFSLILLLIGLALVMAYIPVIILAVCSVPLFQSEAINEEKEIRRTLANEYDIYSKQTGRLFPKIIISTEKK
jgi:protein-S-isoprenylcysteine O-methyltransferase Ste14